MTPAVDRLVALIADHIDQGGSPTPGYWPGPADDHGRSAGGIRPARVPSPMARARGDNGQTDAPSWDWRRVGLGLDPRE